MSMITVGLRNELTESAGAATLASPCRVWEVESGRHVRTLAGHTGEVNALVGLSGGLVASGSDDRTTVI